MTEIKKILDKKLDVKYSVKIQASELQEEINNQAQKQQKTLKMDGFRKGKVPTDVIKNKYSAVLLTDSAEKLIENNVSKIVDENKYNLISRPKIDVKSLEENKDLEFEVSFELYPDVPKIKYDDIKLQKTKIKLEEKDVEEGKKRLLTGKAKWKEESPEYKAKLGDRVNIDFLGKIDGVAFEGGKAEKYNLELGSKSFIDNFEDQLVGKKAGDKVDVKVNFPKNYQKKELAGQPAVFEVVVHSVSTATLPEMTDEFLKENFNIESVSKLEEMIKEELTSMYESSTKNKIKSDIFEWMKKNIKIELPTTIVDDEFNRQWKQVEDELKDNPDKFKSEKDKEKEKDKIRKNAEDSIKLGLILSEIGKSNNIKVEQTEVIDEIRKRASMYSNPQQKDMIVNFYMKNQAALNQITGTLLEDKVIDFIVSKSNVKEVEMTPDEFLKNNK